MVCVVSNCNPTASISAVMLRLRIGVISNPPPCYRSCPYRSGCGNFQELFALSRLRPVFQELSSQPGVHSADDPRACVFSFSHSVKGSYTSQ